MSENSVIENAERLVQQHWPKLSALPQMQTFLVALIAMTLITILGALIIMGVEAVDNASTGKVTLGMVGIIGALCTMLGGLWALYRFMYTTHRETDYGFVRVKGEADAKVARETILPPTPETNVNVAGDVGQVAP